MLSSKVPYFILDLLQQVPTVYVKGLGRFDAIFHPAVIDLPKAQVKPPYIEPYFRDDEESTAEILAAYIHYVTGDGVEKAQEAIDQFVQGIREHTENDQSYSIEKFGTFSKSTLGNIRFTPDWDAFNLSFSGLEVLDLKPAGEISNENAEHIAPPVYTPEVPIYVAPVIETPDVAEIPEEEPIAIDETPVIEYVKKDLSDINESTSKLWWLILSSALVLIAVLCAYLAWDIISNRNKLNELKQIYPDSTFLRPGEITTPIDSTPIIVDNVPIEEPVENIDTTPALEQPVEITNPCFVVVGAFADPANVSKMEARLKDLGYTSELQKGRTLTSVAIRTSCEAANLQKVLNEARATINPEAWIN